MAISPQNSLFCLEFLIFHPPSSPVIYYCVKCEVLEVCSKHDMVQTLIGLCSDHHRLEERRYKTLIAESIQHLIQAAQWSWGLGYFNLTTTTTTKEPRWEFNLFSKSCVLLAIYYRLRYQTELSITNDLVKQMILSLTSTFNQVRERPRLSGF